MTFATRFSRPASIVMRRAWRPVRKALVLSTLSTLGVFAFLDGSDGVSSDAPDGERSIVFRHFV